MLMENDLLLQIHCHYFPRQPPQPACTIQFARVEVERQVEVEEELYCQLDQGGHQRGENAQLVHSDMRVLSLLLLGHQKLCHGHQCHSHFAAISKLRSNSIISLGTGDTRILSVVLLRSRIS